MNCPPSCLNGYDIFEKGLLMLPLFYIFSHEKSFPEYNSNGQNCKILERLNELEQQGVIGVFDKLIIVEFSGDVIREIAEKCENVQKSVGDMMSGALIETNARRIKNQAENESKKKTALRMLKMGKLTIEEIAECFELSVEEVEQLAGLQTV